MLGLVPSVDSFVNDLGIDSNDFYTGLFLPNRLRAVTTGSSQSCNRKKLRGVTSISRSFKDVFRTVLVTPSMLCRAKMHMFLQECDKSQY